MTQPLAAPHKERDMKARIAAAIALAGVLALALASVVSAQGKVF